MLHNFLKELHHSHIFESVGNVKPNISGCQIFIDDTMAARKDEMYLFRKIQRTSDRKSGGFFIFGCGRSMVIKFRTIPLQNIFSLIFFGVTG